ncbi:MAG: hypothetical protein Q8K93_28545 [Reyranella sp.]|nr:hypothetical protein [Reyranella sp.]MDP3829818.1 hypothetical protein [Ignavibacteriaceae bacterium]
MKNLKFFFLFFFSMSVFIGCGGPIMTLLDVKATSDKITVEKAYNTATEILVDKNFDVKVANKDIGLITTEYKKFGSVDGEPPFDFYLQIKTQIKTRADGKLQITLTPLVKESNRLNAAAFTERELVFLSDEEQKGYLNAMKETNLKGQLLFMNVVQGVSEALGVGMEQLEYNKKLSDK